MGDFMKAGLTTLQKNATTPTLQQLQQRQMHQQQMQEQRRQTPQPAQPAQQMQQQQMQQRQMHQQHMQQRKAEDRMMRTAYQQHTGVSCMMMRVRKAEEMDGTHTEADGDPWGLSP